MRFMHWDEIRNKIEVDLDLQDEGFIDQEELLGYVNEAIDDVEANVHTLYEDYFLTLGTFNMIEAQDLYELPTNIYADKIRKLLYVDGATKYEIMRIRDLHNTMFYNSTDDYGYVIVNYEALGHRIKLYPAAKKDLSIPIWYIRNAKRLTLDDTSTDPDNVCDIPEFVNYVIQHAKMRCYEKEMHPNTVKAISDNDKLRDLMVQTLTDKVPDEDNKILPDMDFYYDFDRDAYFNIW